MTNFIKLNSALHLRAYVLLAIVLLISASSVFSQQAKTRVYATGTNNSTDGGGSITDEDLARDGNINSASTLSIGLIGARYQVVSFPQAATNKPVHVKLGGGTNLLTLSPNITIQAYNGGDTDGSFF